MEHYFSTSPRASHAEKAIECSLLGRSLSFLTDASVFSRRRVDAGTRLLIESAEVGKESRVLDLGCGYGVVGIALAPLCDDVVMVDVNERACALARKNAKRNGVSNAKVVCGSLADVEGCFDLILFNPPIRAGKKVYLPLIRQAPDFLSEEGCLLVVVRTSQGAKSLFDFMGDIFETDYVKKKAGYRVIRGRLKN